ncbi:hypothetical protein BC749_101319 [Flavobacterium araucananum]|uniref:T9SS sorting signal type C domain-containing protein n=1 Tax=Flavobacterium araucananum TaxID=946678 RepID=UPI000D6B2A47|nr:T9SS sorting signal type C domain-containing protein [Flavobacterium araucananum]PWK02256.1 hypothetical protein BC749_101319 [Flavobacterium araucananum]
MRLKLSLFLFFVYISLWAQPPHTFTTNGSVVVPAGITSMSVQAWGGGGAGGGASGAGLLLGRGAAGGGGGAYVSGTITVGVGTTLSVVVAGQTAGTLTNGVAGGSSTITGFEGIILAAGGAGGFANTTGNTPSGGSGGTTTASFGTTKTAGNAGGNGGSALLTLGLSSGAGGAGANPTGGAGGAGISSLLLGNSAGNAGSAPGGGGSGAINSASGSPQIGGTGAGGQVIVTYTCPTYAITGTTATNACATDGNATVTVTSSAGSLPVGNYTVTYSRGTPAASGLTASMTVSTAGTGSFTATGLTTVGTSTITVTQLTSGVCPSSISASNVATITISGASVGGTVAGGTTICSGLTSATLTLSGQTGTVVKWQSAISPFSTWTDIANTASTYVSVPLTATTEFRAVVQNGTCSTANSAVTTVTVNPLPAAPVIGTITLPTCAVPTGAVALSGLPSGGTLTLYPGAIVIPYSGTTANVTGLAANTYTFTVYNGTCTSLNSANAVVPGLVTNTYTTFWSNGTPTADQNIIFAGNFTSAGGGAGSINACSCTVNSGVNISILSLDTLTLTNALTNNGGTLTFQNNASFLQTTNAVNTGNIVYNRTSSQIILGDFVYWSTPVNPQKLLDVSPLTLNDKYLTFTSGTWVVTNPNTNMVVGKGYIIRSPQTYSSTIKADYTASFIGVPNNGNISGETATAGNIYLVGNPYPSALSADLFLGANTFLDGTLYFWTHNTPVVLQGAYQYNSNDYASYNLSGGVGTAPAPSGNAGNNNATPSGKIAAGQSFFASANSSGTIAFTNAMRLGGTNNTQFFRNGSTVKQSEVEAHRLWLNMTNDGGAFKQLLVSYIEGATNDNENRYDGETFDANPYLDFYSINNQTNFVIQGRALPFTDTDVVPLGYRSTIAGDFTIAIDHTEGILSNHAIYIEDKTANVIHDLTASNYTFSTGTGTFADRFILRYSNLSLGTKENEKENDALTVLVKDKIITINAFGNENLSTVFVYDVSGKLIYKTTNISDKVLKINSLKMDNQVLLVKVVLDTNNVTTKKIIY